MLPDDWATAMEARGVDLSALYDAVDCIFRDAGPGGVSPRDRGDVFRAFHKTPVASLRVVILGEDPYPDPDQANGLAFSVSDSYIGPRPTSLGRIFGSLRRDLNLVPSRDDLTSWAERGVLLLNVALTHTVGNSVPDVGTWRGFITAVVQTVNDKPAPVAWLLWGDFAVNLADSIPLDNGEHKRFENAHPRAGRANRPLLRAKPPFSAASAFLGSDPLIDWAV